MLTLNLLPTINAVLNGASAILLVLGFVLIRQKRIRAHRICMLSAFTTSALFLASYLVYHLQVGSVAFAGQDSVRLLYYAILVSHVGLAILVVPLGLTALFFGLTRRFARHKGVAHKALPLWLYVSITGVIVYLMLYQLSPSSPVITQLTK